MTAPPVQYVTTTDGVDIAYTVTGLGPPFVFMAWPFNNVALFWDTDVGRPLLESLAQRFRLVQYDSRGQGMSTRGLPDGHALQDYVLDLEAVVDRLQLGSFVLYGGPLFCHVAVHHAVRHPERLKLLILGNANPDIGWDMQGMEELARAGWDVFLHTMTSAYSPDRAPREFAYWRQSLDQSDCLKMLLVGGRSNIRGLLPRVRTPTLILNTRRLTHDALAAIAGCAAAGQQPQHSERNRFKRPLARGEAVRPEQWSDPTPCSEWNVKDIANHVISENLPVAVMRHHKRVCWPRRGVHERGLRLRQHRPGAGKRRSGSCR